MKIRPIREVVLITALLIAIPFPALCEEYQMSGIALEDPRWKNTLDRVNQEREAAGKVAEESGEKKTVEIIQHIEGTSYLAMMRTPQQVAGSMARSMGAIFGRANSSIVPAGEWETVRFDAPTGTKQLADSEAFLKMIETTGDTYQYTTTLGAKATVKVIRLAGTGAENAPLSMQDFVSKLKAGETYTVSVMQLSSTCGFCAGAGKTGGAVCRKCNGMGGDAFERIINVVW